jgi:hypothetical protein
MRKDAKENCTPRADRLNPGDEIPEFGSLRVFLPSRLGGFAVNSSS